MRKKVLDLVLYDKKVVVCNKENSDPPSEDRINIMLDALESKDPLDPTIREELIDSLLKHKTRRKIENLNSKRGASISRETHCAAAIVRELIYYHDASTVYAAAWAAAQSVKWQQGKDPKSVTDKDLSTIIRTYQKLNKSVDGFFPLKGGGKFKLLYMTPVWMDDAIARLRGKRVSTSTAGARAYFFTLSNPIKND